MICFTFACLIGSEVQLLGHFLAAGALPGIVLDSAACRHSYTQSQRDNGYFRQNFSMSNFHFLASKTFSSP